MSRRIRSIKPEILEDAVSAGLSDMAFRIFVSSFLLADDHGNLRFEPAWVRAQIFWARDVPLAAFEEALAEVSPRLIMPYEVHGQRYGHVRGWKKHQKVDHPGKPLVPGPPGEPPESSREPRESVARLSRRSPETVAPDLDQDQDQDQERDPGPREAPPAPRVSKGSASGIEAKATYEQAVSLVTSKPFRLPDRREHVENICLAVNDLGEGDTLDGRLQWLGETVSRWVRENLAHARYMSGWKPNAFVDWLNAGQPKPIAATGTDGPRRREPDMANNPSRRPIRDEDL